jgi:hypothetical protein
MVVGERMWRCSWNWAALVAKVGLAAADAWWRSGIFRPQNASDYSQHGTAQSKHLDVQIWNDCRISSNERFVFVIIVNWCHIAVRDELYISPR